MKVEIISFVDKISAASNLPKEIIHLIKNTIYYVFIVMSVDVNTANALMVLILLDMITGIIKSMTIDSLRFKMRSLRTGLLSKILLIIVPLALVQIGKGINYDFNFLVDIFFKVVIISEGISIITNYLAIRSNKNLENKDYIYRVISWIRKKLVILIDKIINL